MATQAVEQRLYRAREDACIGGVCAGIAEHYDFDAIVVRILAVLLAVLTLGVAVPVYLVMWARLPQQPESGGPYDVRPESAESSAFGCVDCAPDLDDSLRLKISPLARLAVAAGLMVLFLAVAVGVSPLVPGTQWWQFWPVSLLMLGLCLIVIPVPSEHERLWHMAGIVVTSMAASILPMSLGVVSWETVASAFGSLWPLVAVAVALFAVGARRSNSALLLGAVFCIVAFCILGLSLYVVPGDVETLLFQSPTGHSIRISFMG